MGAMLSPTPAAPRLSRRSEHAAERCAHCQARLSPDSKIGEEKRQVFDLPQKPLIVTERRAAIHGCPACGQRTRADFPEGVVSPAQYGERLRAAGVYLNAEPTRARGENRAGLG
jgi:transposase